MNPCNLRTYDLAKEVYRHCVTLKMPSHLRNQLQRAASSVCLNLAEGSAKPTAKDRARFYAIALGSVREVQACLDLVANTSTEILQAADRLGASVYRLLYSTRNGP